MVEQANGHAATGELTSGQVEQLLSAESPPGSATTGDLHGSIAFSQLDRGGYAYAIVWNAQGREAARRAAVEECRRQDGGSGCHEAGWFSNQCGALAIGDRNGYGTGGGETNAKAESDALSNCRTANRNCRVEVSRCVDSDYRRRDPAAQLSGPKCVELPGQYLGENHAECWEEFENRRGCHRWTNHFHSDRTARWSGRCDGGLADGRGTLSISGGGEHIAWEGTGTISRGKLNGRWSVEWADGTRSDAEYRDGEVNGYGTMIWPDGARYEGQWRNDKRHGRGTLTYSSGNRYQGEWRDGKRHGRGTFTFDDGNRYEGAFHDGKAHGWGKVTLSSGETYSGEWRDGCVGGQDHASWMTLGTNPDDCGFE